MMWIGIQECIKIGLQVLKMFAFFHAFFVYSPQKEWKYDCGLPIAWLVFYFSNISQE